MFIKKKVIVKFLKRKDSNEICSLKKQVIVKHFKAKYSNKCVYQKRKSYCEAF